MVGIGNIAPNFTLKDSSGITHSLSDFKGKRVLLSFNRYAACTVCRYNVDRLSEYVDYFTRSGIQVINIFASPQEKVSKYIVEKTKVASSYLTLCDPNMGVYHAYSTQSTAKLNVYGRFKECYENSKQVKKLTGGEIKPIMKESLAVNLQAKPEGRIVPSVFLIDEEGLIVDCCHMTDEDSSLGTVISWDRIDSFTPEDKRCRCNQQNCVSPRCRKAFLDIQANFKVFMG